MMACAKCNEDLPQCTCPDAKERLLAAATSPHIAIKFCAKCDEHYARCKCEEPDFIIRSGNKSLDGKRVEDLKAMGWGTLGSIG